MYLNRNSINLSFLEKILRKDESQNGFKGGRKFSTKIVEALRKSLRNFLKNLKIKFVENNHFREN